MSTITVLVKSFAARLRKNIRMGKLEIVNFPRACISYQAAIILSLTVVGLDEASAAGQLGRGVAVKSDGTVWGWGTNRLGRLGFISPPLVPGNHETAIQTTAIKIPGISNVVSVGTAEGSTWALKADGTVWGWGSNAVINGSIVTSLVPQQQMSIGVRGRKIAVTSSRNSTAVLLDDGTVVGWGDNYYCQLGPKPTSPAVGPQVVLNPQSIPLPSGVIDIAMGSTYNGLALRNDGTVWAWGSHYYGITQRGAGDVFTCTDVPVLIEGVTNATAIAVGASAGAALRSNGTVMVWGGDFQTGTQYPPAVVQGLSNIVAIAVTGSRVVSLSSNGALYYTSADGITQASGYSGIKQLADASLTGLAFQVVTGNDRIFGQSFASLNSGNAFGDLGYGIAEPSVTPVGVVHAVGTCLFNFYLTTPTPPQNDGFANRIALSGANGNVNGTLFGATHEPAEPQQGGCQSPSIWYKWVAPTNGQVSLSVAGGATTSATAYVGTSLSTLAEVGPTFMATAGTEYKFAVFDTVGNFTSTSLTWSVNTNPVADLALSETEIASGSSYDVAVFNVGSTATNVVITGMLPNGVTFVSGTSSNGTCVANGQAITCTVGNLVSGASANISISIQLSDPNLTPKGIFSVSSDVPDLNQSNNTVQVAPVRLGDVPLPLWALGALALGLFGGLQRARRRASV